MIYNQKGFTLLEVLFALVLISIFLLAANKLMYTVKKGNNLSDQLFQVVTYSQNLLEYFKQSKVKLSEGTYYPENIIEKETFNYITRELSPGIYNNTLIKIKRVCSSPQIKEEVFCIQIKVGWEGIAGGKNFKISTYKY